MAFHIVLHSPSIPQNTGAIARLCAATATTLHLIHPLGFSTSDATVKRAGLDYWPSVSLKEHKSWQQFVETEEPNLLVFLSKFAVTPYTSAALMSHCYLVFGNETQGLPQQLRERYANHFFQIPIVTQHVRSLNLAQCAAIVLYEALRRQQFQGLQ